MLKTICTTPLKLLFAPSEVIHNYSLVCCLSTFYYPGFIIIQPFNFYFQKGPKTMSTRVPCPKCGRHPKLPDHNWCLFCRREYYRKWHAANRIKRAAYQKKYRLKIFREALRHSEILRQEEPRRPLNPDIVGTDHEA